MRSLLLCVLSLVLIQAAAFAQEDDNNRSKKIETYDHSSLAAGTFRIGADFIISVEDGDDNYGLTTEINYFLLNNLAIGGEATYRDVGNSTTFWVAANLRYYVMFNERVGIFGKAVLGYQNANANGNPDNDSENGSVLFTATPGLTYFISDRINLETAISPTFNNFGLTFSYFFK
ncbi:hypothetical protein [Persicobacter psychrovividus]|uniref:Outer membrane protein beta-barrel domain-containing protein n=1 Tax=Persicobacter psychrovividus TaxID=387638 RepID=A0ABN6LJH5_9BACT|nr:hypothetical protein PEPS_40370 [Persicobacter psychrovividus]